MDFAREGRRVAGQSAQAIRLAVNGEARALGRLGDRAGVDRSVGEAFNLANQHPAPDGMSPCISFGPYSTARVAANAATAYVSLGETARVREYADMAVQVADRSPLSWSPVPGHGSRSARSPNSRRRPARLPSPSPRNGDHVTRHGPGHGRLTPLRQPRPARQPLGPARLDVRTPLVPLDADLRGRHRAARPCRPVPAAVTPAGPRPGAARRAA